MIPTGIKPLVLHGDVREQLACLPDESVHVVVTSPPFWRLRDYARCPFCAQFRAAEVPSSTLAGGGNVHLPEHTQNRKPDPGCSTCAGTGFVPNVREAQIGMEATPSTFVATLVGVFREVRRVLRSDGVCFLNMGDSFARPAAKGGSGTPTGRNNRGEEYGGSGLGEAKELEEIGVPDMLIAALRDDGWYRRTTIIWAKGRSGDVDEIPENAFSDSGPGNVMPSPDNGWRWEQHRIQGRAPRRSRGSGKQDTSENNMYRGFNARWKGDETTGLVVCPGCDRCTPNGGLVLRKQAWKPTKTFEYVFMLTKTDTYYCDRDAVAGGRREESYGRYEYGFGGSKSEALKAGDQPKAVVGAPPSKRNLRSVLFINPRGYTGAHFAVFPERLVELLIKVATSERGVCPTCGSQYARVIERTDEIRPDAKGSRFDVGKTASRDGGERTQTGERYVTRTTGWKATCDCPPEPTLPAVVLDPFAGSGTTLAVAYRLGLRSIGIELSPVSVKLAAERVGAVAAPSHTLARWL